MIPINHIAKRTYIIYNFEQNIYQQELVSITIDDDRKTYELSTLHQKHVGNDSEDLQSMKHQDCVQKYFHSLESPHQSQAKT